MRKNIWAMAWFAAWFLVGYATGFGKLMFGWAWPLLDWNRT